MEFLKLSFAEPFAPCGKPQGASLFSATLGAYFLSVGIKEERKNDPAYHVADRSFHRTDCTVPGGLHFRCTRLRGSIMNETGCDHITTE